MGRIFFVLLFVTVSFVGAYAETISIENDYIYIGVHDKTARFFMKTKEGDPKTKSDNNKKILLDKTPPTSITVLNIDGYITTYGSADGSYYFRPTNHDGKIITDWMIRGLVIRQILEIVQGTTTALPDTMLITYSISNISGQKKSVGVEIILDIYLGDKDGVPCSINGKLIDKETQFTGANIPQYWYSLDEGDKANVRVQGTLINPLIKMNPDKVIFTKWQRLFDYPWDIEADNSAFPKGKFDNAVAVFFDNKSIPPNGKMTYSTMYGLFGANIFTSEDMNASVVCAETISQYPFPLQLSIGNKSGRELDSMKIKINLPEGLKLSAKSKTKAETELKKVGVDKLVTLDYMIDADGKIESALSGEIVFDISGKMDTISANTKAKKVISMNPIAEAPKEPEKDITYYQGLMQGEWMTVSYFKYNSSKLTPQIKAELDQAAEVFKQFPKGIKIKIIGYTDSDGSEKMNKKLGMNRAKAVYDYLTKNKKLPKSMFVLESQGEDSPISDNNTDDGMSENRRIEFQLMIED
jgi:outer membrane protein OmpA-like peptidoglycan-associated protein